LLLKVYFSRQQLSHLLTGLIGVRFVESERLSPFTDSVDAELSPLISVVVADVVNVDEVVDVVVIVVVPVVEVGYQSFLCRFSRSRLSL